MMANFPFAITVVVLLYFEPLSVFGIKVSHLWKICFLYFVIITLLLVMTRSRLNIVVIINRFNFLKYGFLYSIFPIMASVGYVSPVEDLFFGIQRLFVFIIFLFIMCYPVKHINWDKSFKFIAVLITLSFVPFYFNWLPSLGKSVELSKFGGEGSSLVGVFQNPHAASLALTLVLMYCVFYAFISKTKATTLFYTSISSLNFILLFVVAVRSGIVSAVVGLFAMLISMKVNIRIIAVLTGLLIIFGTIYQFGIIDSSLQKRLVGQNIYTKEHNIDTMSSGRLSIWRTSLKIYSDATIQEKIIGMGIVKFKAKMNFYSGNNIFAHNGFINELCIHGIAGLTILIMFLYSLFHDIMKIRNGLFKPLAHATFFAFITFTFFQSADYPIHFMLILLPITYEYFNYVSGIKYSWNANKQLFKRF